MDLTGKGALVTGGASGIGAAAVNVSGRSAESWGSAMTTARTSAAAAAPTAATRPSRPAHESEAA